MSKAIVAAVIVAVLGGIGLGGIVPPSNQVMGGTPDGLQPSAAMPEQSVAEPEAVPVDEPEPVWEESWSEEPGYGENWDAGWYEDEPYAELAPAYEADGGAPDIYTLGVVDDGERTWTWYSERVLPGNGLDELNANGRMTDDEGFVTDGDGYIAVASPDESVPIGTEVETPWGAARVYDYNPGSSWDLYTSWE